MSYSTQNIRNVCLLGHGGNGKTSLAESMLYLTGGTERLGRTADGNTTCDYDPEETRRQISISTAVAPVEYNGCKINVLDTPGYFDFVGEVVEAVQVADAAIIVCSAKAGMSVGAEKAWDLCETRKLPRLLYISKTDEENADYNAAFATLRDRFGKNVAPVVAPIWDADKKVIGIIDVLHKRAFEAGPKGERIEIDVPADKQSVLDELYDALKESVAETSEEFMDKFFGGEDFTYAEMIQGLRQGVKDLSLFPVVCGSALSGLGTRMLLDIIVELLPNPMEGRPLMGENSDGELDEFVAFPGALPCALVWKTTSDQYGKYSYIKVVSGNIKPDMQLVDSRTGSTEKIGRLYVMKGKKADEVKELQCGDIGAIGKMDKVKTGDTLSDSRKVVKLEPIPFPEPCYSVAIAPKTKGQEDKIASGLTKLNEEDASFTFGTDPETKETVLKVLNNDYIMNIVDTGNVFITYPGDGLPMSYWDDYRQQNLDSLLYPLIKFQDYIDDDNKEYFDEMKSYSAEIYSRISKMSAKEFEEAAASIKEEIADSVIYNIMVDDKSTEAGYDSLIVKYTSFYNENFKNK